MIQKRKTIIGAYNTAENGWTLSYWYLSPPEKKTNMVDKPAGDGVWDISTVLTDGIPIYKMRSLSVTLERSDGTRESREEAIRSMISQLDGYTHKILGPDDAAHYLNGSVSVARLYNDMAHASVSITGTVDPWLYAVEETVIQLTPTQLEQTENLVNSGRKVVVPVIEVTGTGTVHLTYGTASRAVSAGTYLWPDLLLLPGESQLKYYADGDAVVKITYREAVLW